MYTKQDPNDQNKILKYTLKIDNNSYRKAIDILTKISEGQKNPTELSPLELRLLARVKLWSRARTIFYLKNYPEIYWRLRYPEWAPEIVSNIKDELRIIKKNLMDDVLLQLNLDGYEDQILPPEFAEELFGPKSEAKYGIYRKKLPNSNNQKDEE